MPMTVGQLRERLEDYGDHLLVLIDLETIDDNADLRHVEVDELSRTLAGTPVVVLAPGDGVHDG